MEAVLASMVEALAQRNDAQVPADRALTYYDSLTVPGVAIEVIFQRWVEYTADAENVLLAAAIFIERFCKKRALGLHSHSMHRLVIVALVVAAKYQSDAVAPDSYFAQVTGVSVAELRRLQVKFLTDVDFELYISSEKYETVLAALRPAAEAQQEAAAGVSLRPAVPERAAVQA